MMKPRFLWPLFAAAAVHLALMAAPALTQDRFDVYTVKPRETSLSGPTPREEIRVNPGNLYMTGVRLRACIKWAYNIPEQFILGPDSLGPPGWLGSNIPRFDISAKTSDQRDVPAMRVMLQEVLKETFGLTVHMEDRQMKGYILTEGKSGAKLDKSTAEESLPFSLTPTRGAVKFTNIDIGEFAEWLSGPFGTPIANQTMIKGRFDFALDLSRHSTQEDDRQFAIIGAVSDQLGLKLSKGDVVIKTLVVDRVLPLPAGR